MAHNEPFGHIGGYFHAIQDARHTQGGLVEYLCGAADGLLPYCFAGLDEHETQCCQKDESGK